MKILFFLFLFVPLYVSAQVEFGAKVGVLVNSHSLTDYNNDKLLHYNPTIGVAPMLGIKAVFRNNKKIQWGGGIDITRLSTSYDNYLDDPRGIGLRNYKTRYSMGPALSPYLMLNIKVKKSYIGIEGGALIGVEHNKYYYSYYAVTTSQGSPSITGSSLLSSTTYTYDVAAHNYYTWCSGFMCGVHYGFITSITKRLFINPEIGLRLYGSDNNGGPFSKSVLALPITISIIKHK